jgi:MFS transporter, ACS family, tartrate transporter
VALLNLDGLSGLSGWRWQLLLNGTVTCVLGVLLWIFLRDRPEQVRSLAPEERGWLVAELETERQAYGVTRSINALGGLAHGTVWCVGIIFLLANVSRSTYYLPLEHIVGVKGFGLWNSLLKVAAVVCMVMNGSRSDRTGERALHVAIPLFLMCAGLIVAALLPGVTWLAVLGLALAPVAAWTVDGLLYTMPSLLLGNQAAAVGIALVATLASVGSYLGDIVVDPLVGDDSASVGSWVAAGVAGAAALLSLRLRRVAAFSAVGSAK